MYSHYCCRRQAQRRVTMRAATPRPRLLLEHFSLNQQCQLDATAFLATALIVLPWRMSISSQAGAAVSRNVALGAFWMGRAVQAAMDGPSAELAGRQFPYSEVSDL